MNYVWINFENLETFLRNGSFVILFLTMTSYWIETAFFLPSAPCYKAKGQSTSSLNGAVKNPNVGGNLKSKGMMILANISLILLLLVRWETSGHFPLSNLYESLMFLSWCLSFLQLILSANFSVYIENILGSIIAPSALLLNAFASFNLPKEMQQASPLVPALQSNWLMMHVTVMIISYATLIIGSLLSIAFLILEKFQSSKSPNNSIPSNVDLTFQPTVEMNSNIDQLPRALPEGGLLPLCPKGARGKELQCPFAPLGHGAKGRGMGQGASGLGLYSTDISLSSFAPKGHTKSKNGFGSINTGDSSKKLSDLMTSLDFLSYRIIGLGFPFLTIGILSGAVWANEAWGSYWSWDPKETWALLTWLVFAIYLHTRLNFNHKGEKPAIIASFGFIVVWFCYLGVNLIGDGLHSYGFFN